MYTCRHCQGGVDSDYQRVGESCADSDDSDSDYLSRHYIVTVVTRLIVSICHYLLCRRKCRR
jgi:hypothetical protein